MSYAEKTRYFVNNMEDYKPGAELQTNTEALQRYIATTVEKICKGYPVPKRGDDGALYVGSAGVAYAFYYLYKNEVHPDMKENFLKQCVEYLNAALDYASAIDGIDECSFLLGSAGIYAIAAVVFKCCGFEQKYSRYMKRYTSLYKVFYPRRFLRCGSDELFVGRAGYLAGAFWLQGELQVQVLPPEVIHTICGVMLQSGRDRAAQHTSPCPLIYEYYGTEYLGAAHGLAFILQMLMTAPGFLESDALGQSEVKAAVDYLITQQTKDGNFPCAIADVAAAPADELIHWCHGAPGIAPLLARAYLMWGDDKYLQASLACGEAVWSRGLLRKGPGICHGVAGNAYVFLLLYRLTNDKKHLHRANAFFEFLSTPEFTSQARTPDNPFSLFEGEAGTLCFAIDLLFPDKAALPFQNAFLSI